MSTTSPLIGITAEWNPFHAGHSAMIDIIKKAYPQASLIAIMSGAFVQRGEPALFDKWTRAGWAVRAGVDAVFEFPALYALQSADRFSCHAASMLHAMGVNMIAFGARVVGEGTACAILDAFFGAKFEGGRHAQRVAMLDEIRP